MSTLLYFLAGRAAKAGVALIGGLVAGVGGTAVTDLTLNNGNMEMPIWGYIVIGAIGGLQTWAMVYFKRNK